MVPRNIKTASVWSKQWADGSSSNQVMVGSYELLSCSSNSRSLSKPYIRALPHTFIKVRSNGMSGGQTYTHLTVPSLSWTAHGQYRNADLYPDWDIKPGDQNAVYNECLSKLNEQIRGGLDLSVDFAERKKTAVMIRDAFRVVDHAKRLHKEWTNLPRLYRPKIFGNYWLQYQYGWRPLLSSIYGVFQKVMDYGDDKPEPRKFRARAKMRIPIFESYGSVYNTPFIRKGECSLRHEIGVTLRPKASAVANLAGYTSLNPVSLAWELLPYSFVVDWFINIGGYLRNLETALVFEPEFITGYSTSSHRTNCENSIDAYAKVSGSYVATLQAQGSWERTGMSRTVLTSYPFPRIPPVQVNLGSQRLLSAASLLAQFLGK